MALTLPYPDTALLIRTDFSDDQAWHEICAVARAPSSEGFRAGLECIDDEQFEGLTVEQAVSISPVDQTPFFVFLVDRVALEHAERPILRSTCSGIRGTGSASFRARWPVWRTTCRSRTWTSRTFAAA